MTMSIPELRERLAGRTLRGNQNQCSRCGDLFGGFAAFDLHRTGDYGVARRCRTESERFAVGLVRDEEGFWRRRPSPLLMAIRDNARAKTGPIDTGVMG